MRRLISFALVTLFVVMATVLSPLARGEVKTKVIEYKAGDTLMEGTLYWDDAAPRRAGDGGKMPGVVVFPEWWGLTGYPKKRAHMLAELGYVAFAADMYGKGKTTDDPTEAGKWMAAVKQDRVVEMDRVYAAMEVLFGQPQVDSKRTAAIGYCFGGTMALELARRGSTPPLGVVSFHGDLSTTAPAERAGPKVLVLTGGDDKWVTPEQVKTFEDEMKKAGVEYRVTSYPGAQHAFTNPDADKFKLDNVKYNADADKQSWEAMKQFLADLFNKGK